MGLSTQKLKKKKTEVDYELPWPMAVWLTSSGIGLNENFYNRPKTVDNHGNLPPFYSVNA